MKYSKRLNFLNILLNVIIVVMILLLFTFVGFFFMKDKTEQKFISLIAMILLFAGYITITIYLKNIAGSIRLKNPFNLKNVGYLQNIGYIIFTIGIIDAIGNYKNATGIILIGTENGGIKPMTFLYLVLSILSFILSDVFRMAIEIKEDNDLTV